jgi:hypothetical protein
MAYYRRTTPGASRRGCRLPSTVTTKSRRTNKMCLEPNRQSVEPTRNNRQISKSALEGRTRSKEFRTLGRLIVVINSERKPSRTTSNMRVSSTRQGGARKVPLIFPPSITGLLLTKYQTRKRSTKGTRKPGRYGARSDH